MALTELDRLLSRYQDALFAYQKAHEFTSFDTQKDKEMRDATSKRLWAVTDEIHQLFYEKVAKEN